MTDSILAESERMNEIAGVGSIANSLAAEAAKIKELNDLGSVTDSILAESKRMNEIAGVGSIANSLAAEAAKINELNDLGSVTDSIHAESMRFNDPETISITHDYNVEIHQAAARERAAKIDREQQLIDLLGGILQSHKNADQKTDMMLFLLIITTVATLFSLIFGS